MSASNIGYHLRPNKALDRSIFIESLRLIDRHVRNINGAIYITLGGPFLEDIRMMTQYFGFAHYYSVDGSAATVRRQNINRPCRNLSLDPMMSADLITGFDRHCRRDAHQSAVVWLDYTAPSQRPEQIREAVQLFGTLREHDVLRVTLNASVYTLGTPPAQIRPKERLDYLFQLLKEHLGDLLPYDASRGDMLADKFGDVLVRTIRKAFATVTTGEPLPLVVNEYADGLHRMLTITVIKTTDAAKLRKRLASTPIENVPLDWNSQVLRLPELSQLERARIDEQLPPETTISAIDARLGNFLDDDPLESTKILAEYARFRSFYPAFARIFP